MRRWFSLVLILVIFSMVACKKTEPAAVSTDTTATTVTTATTATTGSAATATADTWVDDVTIDIGNKLTSDGAIDAGETDMDFKPGEPVHVSLEIASAPANTPVKVVWTGPKNAKIGEETKNTTAGQKYLTFTSADTKSWAKGDYQAEVFFGDKSGATLKFKMS